MDDEGYIILINLSKYQDFTCEKIISILIHEMFHIFQLDNIIPFRKGITERKKDISYEDLLKLYIIYNDKNYSVLRTFLSNQNDYDSLLIEDIEGTALYVELKYLNIYFNKSINSYLETLVREVKDSKYELIPYVKGLLYCLILDECIVDWYVIYNSKKLLIHEILLKSIL